MLIKLIDVNRCYSDIYCYHTLWLLIVFGRSFSPSELCWAKERLPKNGSPEIVQTRSSEIASGNCTRCSDEFGSLDEELPPNKNRYSNTHRYPSLCPSPLKSNSPDFYWLHQHKSYWLWELRPVRLKKYERKWIATAMEITKKLHLLLPFFLPSLVCSIEVFLQRHVGVLSNLNRSRHRLSQLHTWRWVTIMLLSKQHEDSKWLAFQQRRKHDSNNNVEVGTYKQSISTAGTAFLWWTQLDFCTSGSSSSSRTASFSCVAVSGAVCDRPQNRNHWSWWVGSYFHKCMLSMMKMHPLDPIASYCLLLLGTVYSTYHVQPCFLKSMDADWFRTFSRFYCVVTCTVVVSGPHQWSWKVNSHRIQTDDVDFSNLYTAIYLVSGVLKLAIRMITTMQMVICLMFFFSRFAWTKVQDAQRCSSFCLLFLGRSEPGEARTRIGPHHGTIIMHRYHIQTSTVSLWVLHTKSYYSPQF